MPSPDAVPSLASRSLAVAWALALAAIALAVPPVAADSSCGGLTWSSTSWPSPAGTDYSDRVEGVFVAPASPVINSMSWSCSVVSGGNLLWTHILEPNGSLQGSEKVSHACGSGHVWVGFGNTAGVPMATVPAPVAQERANGGISCRYVVPGAWLSNGYYTFKATARLTYEWDVYTPEGGPHVVDPAEVDLPFKATYQRPGGGGDSTYGHPVCYQDVPTGACTQLCVEDVGCTPRT